MASFNQNNETKISHEEWQKMCVCSNCDKKGHSIQYCYLQQKKEEELKHVEKMKLQYGEQNWMWRVMDTDNDCQIADTHRNWLYNKGVPPDFNINNEQCNKMIEFYNEEDKDISHEEWLEQIQIAEELANAKEYEDFYVLNMLKEYGDEWPWLVVDTEDDCEIAKEHRQLNRGVTYKSNKVYSREFYDNDEEYEKAKCGYESENEYEN